MNSSHCLENNLKLHIISSDIPYPPDYGGMVDVFYKISSLAKAGVKIILHCFQYGRDEAPELKEFCEKVYYYPRKTGLSGCSFKLPYMLYSRRSKALLKNLNKDNAPILFEGIHCVYYLNHHTLKNRFKIIRNQNLEQEYYALLAKRSNPIFKKLYFYTEAKLLKKTEANLHAAEAFLTVAEHDYLFFKKKYPSKIHHYIPSFQANNQVNIKEGFGKYCLYHGNLGHPENEEAALFLIKKVFNNSSYPVIFAGKNPADKLLKQIHYCPNAKLIANPDRTTMNDLIANAHIHVLPTFQPTGLKLKLLNALFNGRFIIANQYMVKGSGLENACIIVERPEDYIQKIEQLMNIRFDLEQIKNRSKLLSLNYNIEQNALKIIDLLR